jgi:hypothetical protein
MPRLTDYTADELASLAPEERSALEAADDSNADTLKQIAESGEGEGAAAAAAPAGDAATPATAPGSDSPAAAAAATPASAAAAPSAEPGPTPAPPPQNVVTYRAEVGEVAKDIQAQKDTISAARAEKREGLKKLNDGEIDFEEYTRIETTADSKIDGANEKILELNRSQTRAEVSVELTQQQQVNAWRSMVQDYVKGAKDKDGIDYTGDAGKANRDELGRLTKAFAVEAEEKGLSDDNGMEASRWALEQAAAVMRVRHPKAAAAATPAAATPAAAPASAAATPAATPAAPAAARDGIPTTLAHMPAAAAAPVADDVMTKISALQGEDLELYLASLPKGEYERVTRAAQ